ncbi:MAG: hypothetical protein RXR82_08990 [Nitrososphaeria archaeon]
MSAGPLSRTLQEVRAGGATERARVFVEALAMEVSTVLAFSMLSVRSGGILESALVLASVVLGILAFGRFGLGRILSAAEGHLRTMEVVFSILVGFVLSSGSSRRPWASTRPWPRSSSGSSPPTICAETSTCWRK